MKNRKLWLKPIASKTFCLPGLSVVAVSVLMALPGVAFSSTEITRSIALKEAYINDDTGDSGTDSGLVSTISPGVNITRRSARSNLVLNYRLDAIFASGSTEQDNRENHILRFFTDYQHDPGRWSSSLRASSQLTNVSNKGTQNVDSNFDDDNSTELRIIGLNTTLTDRLTDTVQYRTSASTDYAEYADSDDGDSSRGLGFQYGLDNFRTTGDFTWSTFLNSQKSEVGNDDERIDSLNVRLNYRLNYKWSTFIDWTGTQTDTTDLNDNNTMVGATWEPNSRNYVSLAVGERSSGDNSYSLDAVSKQRTFTYTANYDEVITTQRTDTLSLQEQQILDLSTSESLSIVPILQKRFTFRITATGKHTTVSGTIFWIDREDSTGVIDETVEGLRLRFTRELSSDEDLSISLLEQHSEDDVDNVDNDLTDVDATYTRYLSRAETLAFSAGWAEQDSSRDSSSDSNYERSRISVQYRVTF